jgi:hypothetical protein
MTDKMKAAKEKLRALCQAKLDKNPSGNKNHSHLYHQGLECYYQLDEDEQLDMLLRLLEA